MPWRAWKAWTTADEPRRRAAHRRPGGHRPVGDRQACAERRDARVVRARFQRRRRAERSASRRRWRWPDTATSAALQGGVVRALRLPVRQRRPTTSGGAAATPVRAASWSMLLSWRKKFGIDLARQEAADLEVGGVFEKARPRRTARRSPCCGHRPDRPQRRARPAVSTDRTPDRARHLRRRCRRATRSAMRSVPIHRSAGRPCS